MLLFLHLNAFGFPILSPALPKFLFAENRAGWRLVWFEQACEWLDRTGFHLYEKSRYILHPVVVYLTILQPLSPLFLLLPQKLVFTQFSKSNSLHPRIVLHQTNIKYTFQAPQTPTSWFSSSSNSSPSSSASPTPPDASRARHAPPSWQPLVRPCSASPFPPAQDQSSTWRCGLSPASSASWALPAYHRHLTHATLTTASPSHPRSAHSRSNPPPPPLLLLHRSPPLLCHRAR